MKSRIVLLFVLSWMASSFAAGQPVPRWVVMAAHGPAASANPLVAYVESNLTDALTAQLAGLPGVVVIDRASVDKVLREQNFQSSDRSSPETAVRIGKLLGAGQIVLLQVYSASYTTHNEQSGNSTRTIGTVVLRASARLIDIETAVILAEPAAQFQGSALVSETSKSGGQYGPIRVPPKQKTSGGDPNVIAENEWVKAGGTVIKELVGRLASAVKAASPPKMVSPLVAGIANGAVYINKGSGIGIKAGDTFQITREVSVGLTDPATAKPMVQKQAVCVLTIVNVSESNASGKCQGGLPQANDVAEPLKR